MAVAVCEEVGGGGGKARAPHHRWSFAARAIRTTFTLTRVALHYIFSCLLHPNLMGPTNQHHSAQTVHSISKRPMYGAGSCGIPLVTRQAQHTMSVRLPQQQQAHPPTTDHRVQVQLGFQRGSRPLRHQTPTLTECFVSPSTLTWRARVRTALAFTHCVARVTAPLSFVCQASCENRTCVHSLRRMRHRFAITTHPFAKPHVRAALESTRCVSHVPTPL
jgi:hypothetical protein